MPANYKSLQVSIPLLSFTFSLAVSSSALAGGPFNGTITGTFSNPVLEGFLIEPSGPPTFLNNTFTAVYDNPIPNGVRWGNPGSSFLIFNPNLNFVNVPSNTDVLLGEILFFNATSDLDTLIFGVDLTIDVAGSGIDPLNVSIPIFTTRNTNISPDFDADFVEIRGLPTLTTLHAFEGQLVSANLFGKVVGDPQIELTSLQLTNDSGFIGDGPVASPIVVPEPSSTIGLFALGALGAGLKVFRKKKR